MTDTDVSQPPDAPARGRRAYLDAEGRRHRACSPRIDWSSTCSLCDRPRVDDATVRPVVQGSRVGAPTRLPLPRGEPHVCLVCFGLARRAAPDMPWDRLPARGDPALASTVAAVARANALAASLRDNVGTYFLTTLLRAAVGNGAKPSDACARRTEALAARCLEQRGRCAYCADPLSPHASTVDHDVPLVRGGRDEPDNLVWACESCNTLKSYLTGDEFRRLLADDRPPSVPSVLAAQTRWRLNAGLSVRPQEDAAGGIDRLRVRRQGPGQSWVVGEGITQWDWSALTGPRALDAGVVLDGTTDARSRVVRVRTWGRHLEVFTATYRERNLPFEQTLDNHRRWIPDRVAQATDPLGFDAIFRRTAKLDYLRSFLCP